MSITRRAFLTRLSMRNAALRPRAAPGRDDAAAIDEDMRTRGSQEEFKRGCDLEREAARPRRRQ